MDLDVESLMVRLLDVAKLFSKAPVSGFNVGAVAKGLRADSREPQTLYLGANLEFVGASLSTCVHAEQSATISAWFHGEEGLESLAVSSEACGHCRQFLHEIARADLDILLAGDDAHFSSTPLSGYLPEAFGPSNLGLTRGLMRTPGPGPKITLETASVDPLVLMALEAARQSYAPYTGNYAGCSIATADGKTYLGRNIENAAYNPSVSPLESAFAFWNLSSGTEKRSPVTRAVLVELRSKVDQLEVSKSVLASIEPKASLEYHEVVENPA